MIAILIFLFSIAASADNVVPEGFVNLEDVDPTILVEMRYNTDWNFLGRRVLGYEANICYLTVAAANALKRVQTELSEQGLSLLVFDCYRPQRAVNDFISWMNSGAENDGYAMKDVFYKEVHKSKLISNGYLARRSGHSRGNTVDLTLVQKSALTGSGTEAPSDAGLRFREEEKDCRDTAGIESTGQLDMGTIYDCFSLKSGDQATDLETDQQTNRDTLKNVMIENGFRGYKGEWWHFTLVNEPDGGKYFDFVVGEPSDAEDE